MTPLDDDTTVLPAVIDGAFSAPPEPERAEDLAEELARAAPKQWWNKGTVVLGAIVLLVGGFVGGLQAQKHWGTAATSAGATGFNQGRAGYGAGAGNRGAYGNFGGGQLPGAAARNGTGQNGSATGGTTPPATTGTVKLVDGTTLYVQTSDGNVVTVNTDGHTSVSATSRTTLKSLKAGDTVTVAGAAAADGTVTATSVTTQHK